MPQVTHKLTSQDWGARCDVALLDHEAGTDLPVQDLIQPVWQIGSHDHTRLLPLVTLLVVRKFALELGKLPVDFLAGKFGTVSCEFES